jgi:hypothetical protein
MHSFLARGKRAAIQTVLDRMFDAPSDGRIHYTAASSSMFVGFAHIARVTSADPEEQKKGYMSEIDVAIWLTAFRTKPFSPFLRWIPIVLLVDSAPAMAIGREAYGFPKQLGHFTIPDTAPSNGPWRAQALVVKAFDPNATPSCQPLIEVERVGRDRRERALEWRSLGDASSALAEALYPDPTRRFGTLAQFRSLLGGSMTMAFLKQFPDIHDVSQACFQQIVEAPAEVLQFRRGGILPGSFALTVHSYASHPLFESLGISATPQRVPLAVWFDFDFLMHYGAPV